jgi:hypothetical protein
MGELGTHLAIERASVGNSPPKAIRAAFLPDGDGSQRPLRSGFQWQVKHNVFSRKEGKMSLLNLLVVFSNLFVVQR